MNDRSSTNQAFVVSERDQLLESLPYLSRNVLLDLETSTRIISDPLQITEHNVDDQVFGKLGGWVLSERDGRRCRDHLLAGPEVHQRGVGPPLHIRLLDKDQALRV